MNFIQNFKLSQTAGASGRVVTVHQLERSVRETFGHLPLRRKIEHVWGSTFGKGMKGFVPWIGRDEPVNKMLKPEACEKFRKYATKQCECAEPNAWWTANGANCPAEVSSGLSVVGVVW